MPCTAKKDEAVRPAVLGDIDAVLTTRKLAKLIWHRGIHFASLPNNDEYNSPVTVIFGAIGGVLELSRRRTAHKLGIKAPIEWIDNRGIDSNIKVAAIPDAGSAVAVNSLHSQPGDREQRPRHHMVDHANGTDVVLLGGGEVPLDDHGKIKYLAQ